MKSSTIDAKYTEKPVKVSVFSLNTRRVKKCGIKLCIIFSLNNVSYMLYSNSYVNATYTALFDVQSVIHFCEHDVSINTHNDSFVGFYS